MKIKITAIFSILFFISFQLYGEEEKVYSSQQPNMYYGLDIGLINPFFGGRASILIPTLFNRAFFNMSAGYSTLVYDRETELDYTWGAAGFRSQLHAGIAVYKTSMWLDKKKKVLIDKQNNLYRQKFVPHEHILWHSFCINIMLEPQLPDNSQHFLTFFKDNNYYISPQYALCYFYNFDNPEWNYGSAGPIFKTDLSQIGIKGQISGYIADSVYAMLDGGYLWNLDNDNSSISSSTLLLTFALGYCFTL